MKKRIITLFIVACMLIEDVYTPVYASMGQNMQSIQQEGSDIAEEESPVSETGCITAAEAETEVNSTKTSNGLKYTVSGNNIIITGYESSISSNLVIPSEIEGKIVTTIDDYAFDDCTELEELILPDCLQTIGERAFDDCSSLKAIVLPDSVTGIGYKAFVGCSGLTSVTLPVTEPEMIERSGNYHGEIFTGYSSLATVAIPSGWKKISDKMLTGSSITSIDLTACTEMTEIADYALA